MNVQVQKVEVSLAQLWSQRSAWFDEYVRYVRRALRKSLLDWQEKRMALPLPRRGEGRGEGQPEERTGRRRAS
jgi:hypothetical protein